MKLELKHLAPYLPYGLKSIDYFDGHKLIRDVTLFNAPNFFDQTTNAKILLRPLSQLTQEIEHDGERFVPMEKMQQIYKSRPIHFDGLMFFVRAEKSCVRRFKEYPPLNISQYDLFQKLFEWHFDVFGLIDKGLAIAKEN